MTMKRIIRGCLDELQSGAGKHSAENRRSACGGDLPMPRESWLLCADVGRHNAVDKVDWLGILEEQTAVWTTHVLLVSGRASFEILQKALAARVPIVCAVSAPSSLAVEFAAGKQPDVDWIPARGDR